MTAAVDVVRQFEIRVESERALNDVEKAIDQALPATLQRRVNKVLRPPVLEVRLDGASSLVTDAMASIARLPGARVRNDVIRTPTDGRKGLVFPDPEARVRIGVDSLPPSRGPAATVTMAIVDSGIMVDHPRLAGRLWKGERPRGEQFIKNTDGTDRPNDDLHDQDGHGTLLAGTVMDAAGDTPVELIVAKFFDSAHSARPDNATKALNYVVENKAQIILLAWDVGLGSIALEEAFRRACQQALVVIAAGNYGSDNDWDDKGKTLARAPVRYARAAPDSTIVVMAADETGKAWFSNYGKHSVDLAAPGINITSTRRCLTKEAAAGPRGIRTHGGTSAAAALVAGAAAQIMSRYPGLTVPQVKQSLTDSAGRRLDIAAALGLAENLART